METGKCRIGRFRSPIGQGCIERRALRQVNHCQNRASAPKDHLPKIAKDILAAGANIIQRRNEPSVVCFLFFFSILSHKETYFRRLYNQSVMDSDLEESGSVPTTPGSRFSAQHWVSGTLVTPKLGGNNFSPVNRILQRAFASCKLKHVDGQLDLLRLVRP